MLDVGFLVNPKSILWYHVRSFLWPIRMITFHLVSGMIVSFYYIINNNNNEKNKIWKIQKNSNIFAVTFSLYFTRHSHYTIPTFFDIHSFKSVFTFDYYELWISLLKHLCLWSFFFFLFLSLRRRPKRFKNSTDWFEAKVKPKSETQMNRF